MKLRLNVFGFEVASLVLDAAPADLEPVVAEADRRFGKWVDKLIGGTSTWWVKRGMK